MWMLLKSIKYSLQVLIWAAPQLVITTTQCRGQRSSRFQVRGSCHRWCGCCRRPSPPQPAFQGSYVLYTARIACVNPLSDLRNAVQRKRGIRCTGTWCVNTCWWQQYCNEMRVILTCDSSDESPKSANQEAIVARVHFPSAPSLFLERTEFLVQREILIISPMWTGHPDSWSDLLIIAWSTASGVDIIPPHLMENNQTNRELKSTL